MGSSLVKTFGIGRRGLPHAKEWFQQLDKIERPGFPYFRHHVIRAFEKIR
jgi:hypothetical protein